MKILAITQARIGSTRFPKKILQEIAGISLLELHLQRLLQSKRITKLKIATTNEEESYKIIQIGEKLGIESFKGDTFNVLDRFYNTAKPEEPDYVVRVTSDCPLIDPILVDEVIDFTLNQDLDYASNTLEEVYPDGQDVEVFKFSALESAWKEATLDSDKEHVTPFIHKNSTYQGNIRFKSKPYLSNTNYNHVRLTVDEPIDFEVIKSLIEKIGTQASWQDYTELYLKTEIKNLNSNITRNEGYQKSIKND